MAAITCQQEKGNWMRLLVNGDEQAFARFVADYQETVFLCCRTLGLNETEAEDVASETFLAAYQKLSKFRGDSSLSTWLWKIAYYKGINYLRKNKKHSHANMEIDEQLSDQKMAHVAARLEDAEQYSAIWDAVNALPMQWAMAIILFYREDKSVEEIAKIMQKRYNTIKTYLFRGRKKLKGVLGDII